MGEIVKYLVVKNVAEKEDCNVDVEEMSGDGWEYREEKWNSVSLEVVSWFDDRQAANEKAAESISYSMVSVFEDE